MEKEVFILTQEQLDAYVNWEESYQAFRNANSKRVEFSNTEKIWLVKNPNPLPSPVKVLTEEEIEKKPFKDFHSTVDKETFCAGYNACLSDLGLK